jgi:two-component system CheB/CheR fusion protein
VLLRGQTGHDFSQYKPNTIMRRIERRMAVNKIETIDGYVKLLQNTKSEVEALFRDLLIGVTSFFRDGSAFGILEEKIIPGLFAGKSAGSMVRVWCAGCSTGEEAYSIAILIHEHMEAVKQNYNLQLFATDIDNRAIAAARSGVFPASIAADISSDRLARFFTPEQCGPECSPQTYTIHKKIRDMLIFSEQNILKDPPFSKLDLICCRNLMIYLSSDLQNKLIPLFHYALNPGGILFLGSSESVGEYTGLFETLDRKAKIYQRKDAVPSLQRMPLGSFLPPMMHGMGFPLRGNGKNRLREKLPLRDLAEQTLLQLLAPSSALVNAHGDILYLHGRSGMYLEPATGEVGIYNILKMARDGLRRELIMSLHKASLENEIVRCPGLSVRTNGHFSKVNLTVCPVISDNGTPLQSPLYLVVLEECPVTGSDLNVPQEKPAAEGSGADSARQEKLIASLRQQLLANEEYLHAANEELETSNEELKSSNEEMQSVNEELQSTNEELETSKEELQSVNEELATVNAELQNKVTDLSRANNDMNNLLSGTGVATVFVDHHLRILRFTPTASLLINLISSDIGRPVGHIVSNLIDYDRLVADTQDVLDTLIPKEVQVQTVNGNWYAMRIMPYRMLDNVIEGAVITFVDITEAKSLYMNNTELKRLQEVLQRSEATLKSIVDNTPDYINIIDRDLSVTYVNHIPPGLPAGSFIGRSVFFGISDEAEQAEGRKRYKRIFETGKAESWEMKASVSPGLTRWYKVEAAPIFEGREIQSLLVISTDITEIKQAEEEIKKQLQEKEVLLKEVHHRIKNNIASVANLLAMQADSVTSPEALSALQDAIGRVESMRVLYDKLLSSEDYQDVSVRSYIESLIESIVTLFPENIRLTVDKEIMDFNLVSKKLFPLGIILNEIFTNIMKYAFINRDNGTIRVILGKVDNHVALSVQDNGNGIPENFDSNNCSGFGLMLIRLLSKQLGGNYTMENHEGTRSTLEFDV